MKRTPKKLPQRDVLIQIQRIRSRNNRLWMKLLAVAVGAKPRKTKAILRQIVANDLEVTKWTSRV